MDKELIRKLRQGKSIQEIATALDMRKQTIQAMLETLVDREEIKEINVNSTCSNCPMSKSCPLAGQGREKLYAVPSNTDDKGGVTLDN